MPQYFSPHTRVRMENFLTLSLSLFLASLFYFHQKNSSHYFYHLQFLSFMINETFISIFFLFILPSSFCVSHSPCYVLVLFLHPHQHLHIQSHISFHLTHYLLFILFVDTFRPPFSHTHSLTHFLWCSSSHPKISNEYIHTMTRQRKEKRKDKILIKSTTMSTHNAFTE